ncbi:protein spinster homolog 1-like isoform X1 [Mytilus californianus]|uniref:protein spinster homolog 1-like isoform X1 n=1 Tax=Mytilus californianus TaxID=6549 RepID=UPI00224735AC|nr:protein spinster homolog 1-like isoform X1 [Mytilus californianus]
MSLVITPIDDTFQLDAMPVDVSDTEPIVQNNTINEDDRIPNVTTTPEPTIQSGTTSDISKGRAFVTVAILLTINLLNYMDRYTVAGVLNQIQNYYNLGSASDGLLQTVFIGTYMIFSPIFGYLGDRYTRKYIMAGGIFFWSCVTLAGSFVDKEHKLWFFVLRAAVGVGEASYSTIAPTLIADLFVGDLRTRMLMIFYFAIPVGSGMGYIVGSNIAEAFGHWQWALRFTPTLGMVCVILIVFVLKEPQRGHSEGGRNLHNTTFLSDLMYLFKNKSFMLSTFGFTCVAFVTGALALWAPLYMQRSISVQGGYQKESIVSLTFGGITIAAGFIGVFLGAESSRRYKRLNPRADPLICAFGLLSCTPFLFFALVVSKYNTTATWILIFLGEVCLCLNWSIVADMLLYCVIPTRRSAAEAVQILMSHALGDAGSPYLIGLISDALAKKYKDPPKTPSVQFATLQSALYMTPFICVVGGGFFLATALFIEKDRKEAEKITKGYSEINVDSGDDADFDDVNQLLDDDDDGLLPHGGN